jgi:DNA-binding NarL/FixJ family response regulator
VQTVVVIDDHQVFAELLAMALEVESGFVCVGHAQTIESGLAMVDELLPDIVLMDVRLSDGDGIAATAELTQRYPLLRVVVLTAFMDRQLLQRAAAAKACALLPKDGELAAMLRSLHTAKRGTFVVSPEILSSTMVPTRREAHQVPTLTRREQEVLQMLAVGLEPRVIAAEIGISIHTCRGYIKSLLAKVGAHSQLEAVAIAVQHGLLHVDADT